MNLFVDQSNYEVLKEFEYTLETKTETANKSKLVIWIETLLDTMFIALQDKRERNQKGSSKQKTNTTPLFVKGTKPQIQDFKSKIVSKKKCRQKEKAKKTFFFIITETESVQKTPFRKTKSVHSILPYDTESHQPLYLEEILTQKVGENWKEFNNWIKTWQSQKGYKGFKNKGYN